MTFLQLRKCNADGLYRRCGNCNCGGCGLCGSMPFSTNFANRDELWMNPDPVVKRIVICWAALMTWSAIVTYLERSFHRACLRDDLKEKAELSRRKKEGIYNI